MLLPCLGTALASSFPASCQPSSSSPPSSGSIVAAWSHLSSRSTTAPVPFCTVAPATSPSESGHRMSSSPSAASRPARQRTLSLAAGGPTRQSQTCFPTWRGGFCTPGTGRAFTASTDTVPIPSTGTATVVRPLTSSPSSRGQSSGGALWRAAYTPG
jgi:hypothetical protein